MNSADSRGFRGCPRTTLIVLSVTILSLCAVAQSGPQTDASAAAQQPQSTQQPQSAQPTMPAPTSPQSPDGQQGSPAGSQANTPPTLAPDANGQQPAAEPDKSDSGMFVFKKQVEEVVLHATVLDEQRRPVP